MKITGGPIDQEAFKKGCEAYQKRHEKSIANEHLPIFGLLDAKFIKELVMTPDCRQIKWQLMESENGMTTVVFMAADENGDQIQGTDLINASTICPPFCKE